MSARRDGDDSPIVTIGIPAYCRPEGLASTLRAMRSQTLRSIRILVSDNASEPSLEEVVRVTAAGDPRVEYHRHPSNIGMMENFHWLVKQARTPYFMWAADDDGWDDDWVETLVDLLESSPQAHLACGRFCSAAPGTRAEEVDVTGLDGPTVQRMVRYFWRADKRLPHCGGYGGYPLYGLFRTDLIRREWHVCVELAESTKFGGRWNGADTIFLYHLLQQTPIVTTTKTRFYYGATRPAAAETRSVADYVATGKLRQHARNIAQGTAHHLDYLWAPQPLGARLAVLLSLAPKLATTVGRHEAHVLRTLLERER